MEQNHKTFSKGTILIILILFMFLPKIYNIVLNIVKQLFFLILIINGIKYFNPQISKQIKEIIIGLINIDSNGYFIKDILSKISGNVLNIVNPNFNSNPNPNPNPNPNQTSRSFDGESFINSQRKSY